MFRVLVIGCCPQATDFSDPAIPPGLDKAKVVKGIEDDLRKMRKRGLEAAHLSIRTDDAQLKKFILNLLSSDPYDCIVIGGGVRRWRAHDCQACACAGDRRQCGVRRCSKNTDRFQHGSRHERPGRGKMVAHRLRKLTH